MAPAHRIVSAATGFAIDRVPASGQADDSRRHDPRSHAATIMAWFDVSGGRLRFRRTSRQPVREWLETREGAQAVESIASGIGFSLFGRSRAARRRLTQSLSEAMNSASSRAALDAECQHFLKTWTQLAYAPALPRLTLDGHRLVVVPRTMIVGRSAGAATKRLGAALGPSVPDDFKAFFALWILRAMDDAVRRAAPDPKHPVLAEESWSCVHIEPSFLWVDTMVSGEPWRGHVMMFELPQGGLKRRDRQALVAAIAKLTGSLPNLTRLTRDGTVRLAFDQLATMRF